MSGPFRALSLDLWFTTLYFQPAALAAWGRARRGILRETLRDPAGAPFPEEALRAGERALAERLRRGTGRALESLPPQRFLVELAAELGGELRGAPEELARRYSDAGLVEAPPCINPEAVRLARTAQASGLPVIAITNTARTAASWARFFEARGGPRFGAIVTSCEVGQGKPGLEIFRVAAEQLRIPCDEVLHVGDRWDIDIEGARRSGMGRVLYRGLWGAYPQEAERELSLRLDDGGTDVVRVDRLDEVLAVLGLAQGSGSNRSAASSATPGGPT